MTNNNTVTTRSISDSKIKELEHLVVEKDRRIAHLEDGLRETVEVATERELVLQKEETKRQHIMEKVRLVSTRMAVTSLPFVVKRRLHFIRVIEN